MTEKPKFINAVTGEPVGLERCWICDEFTGNSGRGEDSLYDDEGGGAYCSDCWDEQDKEGSDED